jgi:hypothetical protein
MNIKKTPYDNLLYEIAQEKFSALRRILEHLSGSLQELEDLDGKIQKAREDHISPQDINKMIERFNLIREDAKEWRYYFVVTREVSGLKYYGRAAVMHKIPPRKSKLG